MAMLVVIFDGAIPQPLAKDRLLNAVRIGSTGNAAIRNRLGFVTNEHIATRAARDPVEAVGCAVPYGGRRVNGRERTVLAKRSRWALLHVHVCMYTSLPIVQFQSIKSLNINKFDP